MPLQSSEYRIYRVIPHPRSAEDQAKHDQWVATDGREGVYVDQRMPGHVWLTISNKSNAPGEWDASLEIRDHTAASPDQARLELVATLEALLDDLRKPIDTATPYKPNVDHGI